MLTVNGQEAGQQCPAPFLMAASTYFEMGLSLIPCNGKKPALKGWKRYQQQRVTPQGLDSWLRNRARCNIGIVTGELSGITVIDSDDPQTALAELMAQFGKTPLVVQTPSGGYHLYYRYNGEANQTGWNGRKIDIRGQGGYVIAPPSWNASTGRKYRFVIGDEWEFTNLTEANLAPVDAESIPLVKGTRNSSLFRHIKELALRIDDPAGLLEAAELYNEAVCDPPVSDRELRGIITSVLAYKADGKLYARGVQRIPFDKRQHIALWNLSADAVCLLDYLKAHHAGRTEPFAISAKALQKTTGIDSRRIAKAVAVLLEAHVIRRVHEGGKHKGDPHLYLWVQNPYPI